MMLAWLATMAMAAQADRVPRETLGVFDGWGAFRDASPRRCYAIAAPVRRARSGAFGSVAFWPGEGIGQQLHIRLSRARTPRARVTLAIGARRFALVAGPRDAWAPDPATDRAIVAAMRGSRSMSVETIAANGAPFADVYALAGAATAIDAAGVACAR
ncbi:hypothetical protein [Sphingomonas baiyangensis]|uniref:Invasion associated locus B family protein n=1 Tax=Sphingomonas baiyangensis TaxID=2572576 RepID=A0A4U1L4P3_9SPHN|nr:hypothetical protein [Sphingomonas baiyangensis]TKD51504.1 hypothetical protein FBR43_12630 [Sphingomonas baiyangensis]